MSAEPDDASKGELAQPLGVEVRLVPRSEGASIGLRPTAWLVDSGDARDWVDALDALGGGTGHRVFAVPADDATRKPVAALIVVHPAAMEALLGESSAQPLWSPCPGVFVPDGAGFEPRLSSTEADALFPMPVHLLHPRHGHVAFEDEECLPSSALVQVNSTRSSDWGWGLEAPAPPAVVGPFRIQLELRALDALQSEFADEVGGSPLELDRPSTLKERLGSIGAQGLIRVPARWLAHAALWYIGRLDDDPHKEPGLIERAAEWAHGVLAAQRNRQKARKVRGLIEMLREDPDRGLRYAIPMSGDPLEFGRTWHGQSGHHESSTEFDLGALGASRGISAWTADVETRQELRRLYEAQAIKDVAAGNPRRAAYIYARLLGDMRQAAVTLENAGFAQEAAVIWRDHVGSKRDAARCLEEAGCIDEALVLLHELGDFAGVSRLLRQHGRHAEAEAMWRERLKGLLDRSKIIQAAAVLERELDSPPRGGRGAPRGLAFASRCCRLPRPVVRGLRPARHAPRSPRVAKAGGPHGPPGPEGQNPYLNLAQRCPDLRDPELRAELEDRLLVAHAFALQLEPQRQPRDMPVRWALLRALRPDDPLLKRDFRTHEASCQPREAPKRARPRSRRRESLRPTGTTQLELMGPRTRVRDAIGDSLGMWLLCFGERTPSAMSLHTFPWGQSKGPRIHLPETANADTHFRSGLDGSTPWVYVLAPPLHRALKESATDLEHPDGSRVSVGLPSFVPDGTEDLIPTPAGGLWSVRFEPSSYSYIHNAIVSHHAADGTLLRAVRVKEVKPPLRLGLLGGEPVLFDRGGSVTLGAATRSKHTRRPVLTTAPSAPGTAQRLLVIYTQDAYIYRAGETEAEPVKIHKGPARGTITLGGAIVLATPDEIRVLRTQEHEVHLVARCALPAPFDDIAAVTGGPRPNSFCIVTVSGAIHSYGLG